MREALVGKPRFIVTPRVSKYRVFCWRDAGVLPDSATTAIARADDATFGILQSRFHELWALRLGTALEDRPRYTPSSCFETFPFPLGMTPRDTAAGAPSGAAAEQIALASRRLVELRDAWLNPVEWVELGYDTRGRPCGLP